MILTASSENISLAGRILREEGLVAIPTETVYGLAARIDSESALRMIFAVKGRPADNPLIVHVASIEQAHSLVLPAEREVLDRLAAEFWPGPLSIVLRKTPGLSDLITCGLDTVAIRMPHSQIAMSIIEAAGGPLAAPSANRSGRPSPTTAAHVEADLGPGIVTVDGGPCDVGIESTVVQIKDGLIVVLRPGMISAETLASRSGLRVADAKSTTDLLASPGTRYRHYSPTAPIEIVDTVEDALEAVRSYGTNTMILARQTYHALFAGCLTGSLTEHDLYSELRRADDLLVDRIVVLCDDTMAGKPALLNRVRKAAGIGIDEDPGT